MKKVFLANSFKRKLMVALMSVGLVPLIIISILYQNILNNRIVEDTNAASIEKLKYLSMNIERQIDAAEQLLGWITYNQRLEQILKKSYDQVYEKQMDIIEFSSYTMEYAINANVENKIFKILIMNEDGSSFQMGNVSVYNGRTGYQARCAGEKGKGFLIHAAPNTNLMDPKTVIPSVVYEIIEGTQTVMTEFLEVSDESVV